MNNPEDMIWQALQPLKSAQKFARGDLLFQQGRSAYGVYLVESGVVNLLLAGKTASVFEVARTGAVLGLSESLTGEPYKLSAEAAADTDAAFVDRQSLLEYLRQHHEVCMEIVRFLSEDLHALYFRFRALAGPDGRPRNKLEVSS